MLNVIMSVTCMLNIANKDLHFEVTEHKKIQSIHVFDIESALFHDYSANKQKISSSEISFSAQDTDGKIMNVKIDLNVGSNYGMSDITMNGSSEKASCSIGIWD